MGQSAEFGKFLKAMRSRLTPEKAGISSHLWRPPGCRVCAVKEIARLADVSTDYYTRLEQGRNIHPSRAVLDSVARALYLDPGEHAYMMDLLENCAKSQRPAAPAQVVRPALRQLLDAVGNVPALILGRRTDVLAGNRLAFLLLADFPAMPEAERNLTRWIILDPSRPGALPGLEDGRLRSGRNPSLGCRAAPQRLTGQSARRRTRILQRALPPVVGGTPRRHGLGRHFTAPPSRRRRPGTQR